MEASEKDLKEIKCRVEGYACTLNSPYELYSCDGYMAREQIGQHAFDGCDMSDVIMQYHHEGRAFARTSNNTLKLYGDKHGLQEKQI